MIKAGREFIVNTYTLGAQQYPKVAALSNGGFVIVWESDTYQDPYCNKVAFFQIFDKDGNKVGTETFVNQYSCQRNPSVASWKDGFVIIWEGDAIGTFTGAIQHAVHSQRFTLDGQKIYRVESTGGFSDTVLSEISYNANQKRLPISFDPISEENYVVRFYENPYLVYQGLINTQSNLAVGYVRTCNSFEYFSDVKYYNSNKTDPSPSPTSNKTASACVPYYLNDVGLKDYFVSSIEYINLKNNNQKYYSSLLRETIQNEFTILPTHISLLDLKRDNLFCSTWSAYASGDSISDIFIGKFILESYGFISISSIVKVNSYTLDAQVKPVLILLQSGHIMIAWESKGQDGNIEGVYAQLFDTDLNKYGDEFRINDYNLDAQKNPDIVVLNNGNVVITWDSRGQDGSVEGVYTKILENVSTPTTSGTKSATHKASDTKTSTVTKTSIDVSDQSQYIIKSGREFIVNTNAIGAQQYPSVAALSNGGFVIVWEGDGVYRLNPVKPGEKRSQPTYCAKLAYFQIFDKDGNKVGPETLVNEYSCQRNPYVASSIDSFVIVWEGDSISEVNEVIQHALHSQKFTLDGQKIYREYITNSFNDTYLKDIVYHSEHKRMATTFSPDESEYAIVYSNDRKIQQAIINTSSNLLIRHLIIIPQGCYYNPSYLPSVKYISTNETLITWKECDIRSVILRENTLISPLTLLNGNNENLDLTNTFDILRLGSNSFILAFSKTSSTLFDVGLQRYTLDKSNYNQYFFNFGGSGIKVNSYDYNTQNNPAITMMQNGNIMVTWQSYGQDTSVEGIYAQEFYPNLTKKDEEFRVNSYTLDAQKNPVIATLSNGNIVIAWDSRGQDGSGEGIYAKLFGKNFSTPTPAKSNSYTDTSSLSYTNTMSSTTTSTPTHTESKTNTKSQSVSNTASSSHTLTQSSTPSKTATYSDTSTDTDTITQTRTLTPTTTYTDSRTKTKTSTKSQSVSNIPSSSHTLTRSKTKSVSKSVTLTPTLSPAEAMSNAASEAIKQGKSTEEIIAIIAVVGAGAGLATTVATKTAPIILSAYAAGVSTAEATAVGTAAISAIEAGAISTIEMTTIISAAATTAGATTAEVAAVGASVGAVTAGATATEAVAIAGATATAVEAAGATATSATIISEAAVASIATSATTAEAAAAATGAATAIGAATTEATVAGATAAGAATAGASVAEVTVATGAAITAIETGAATSVTVASEVAVATIAAGATTAEAAAAATGAAAAMGATTAEATIIGTTVAGAATAGASTTVATAAASAATSAIASGATTEATAAAVTSATTAAGGSAAVAGGAASAAAVAGGAAVAAASAAATAVGGTVTATTMAALAGLAAAGVLLGTIADSILSRGNPPPPPQSVPFPKSQPEPAPEPEPQPATPPAPEKKTLEITPAVITKTPIPTITITQIRAKSPSITPNSHTPTTTDTKSSTQSITSTISPTLTISSTITVTRLISKTHSVTGTYFKPKTHTLTKPLTLTKTKTVTPTESLTTTRTKTISLTPRSSITDTKTHTHTSTRSVTLTNTKTVTNSISSTTSKTHTPTTTRVPCSLPKTVPNSTDDPIFNLDTCVPFNNFASFTARMNGVTNQEYKSIFTNQRLCNANEEQAEQLFEVLEAYYDTTQMLINYDNLDVSLFKFDNQMSGYLDYARYLTNILSVLNIPDVVDTLRNLGPLSASKIDYVIINNEECCPKEFLTQSFVITGSQESIHKIYICPMFINLKVIEESYVPPYTLPDPEYFKNKPSWYRIIAQNMLSILTLSRGQIYRVDTQDDLLSNCTTSTLSSSNTCTSIFLEAFYMMSHRCYQLPDTYSPIICGERFTSSLQVFKQISNIKGMLEDLTTYSVNASLNIPDGYTLVPNIRPAFLIPTAKSEVENNFWSTYQKYLCFDISNSWEAVKSNLKNMLKRINDTVIFQKMPIPSQGKTFVVPINISVDTNYKTLFLDKDKRSYNLYVNYTNSPIVLYDEVYENLAPNSLTSTSLFTILANALTQASYEAINNNYTESDCIARALSSTCERAPIDNTKALINAYCMQIFFNAYYLKGGTATPTNTPTNTPIKTITSPTKTNTEIVKVPVCYLSPEETTETLASGNQNSAKRYAYIQAPSLDTEKTCCTRLSEVLNIYAIDGNAQSINYLDNRYVCIKDSDKTEKVSLAIKEFVFYLYISKTVGLTRFWLKSKMFKIHDLDKIPESELRFNIFFQHFEHSESQAALNNKIDFQLTKNKSFYYNLFSDTETSCYKDIFSLRTKYLIDSAGQDIYLTTLCPQVFSLRGISNVYTLPTIQIYKNPPAYTIFPIFFMIGMTDPSVDKDNPVSEYTPMSYKCVFSNMEGISCLSEYIESLYITTNYCTYNIEDNSKKVIICGGTNIQNILILNLVHSLKKILKKLISNTIVKGQVRAVIYEDEDLKKPIKDISIKGDIVMPGNIYLDLVGTLNNLKIKPSIKLWKIYETYVCNDIGGSWSLFKERLNKMYSAINEKDFRITINSQLSENVHGVTLSANEGIAKTNIYRIDNDKINNIYGDAPVPVNLNDKSVKSDNPILFLLLSHETSHMSYQTIDMDVHLWYSNDELRKEKCIEFAKDPRCADDIIQADEIDSYVDPFMEAECVGLFFQNLFNIGVQYD